MNIFELFGRIAIDNTEALKQISKTSKAATEIGKSFKQAQATSGKSLSQIAAENGKTVNQIRSEVAKAAAEYKKQGMSASAAMKKAYADIGYSAEKAHEKINQETEKTGTKYSKLANTAGKAFDKVGKFAINCGKVVAKGMAVGATAMAGLVASSVKAYADYEQLVGGVETLFKDSADTVMQYAKNAYKTAGLSANDYMSTVTSFSARLLQGLGGDTAAAAKVADLAITDMADNANKMGTDISSIQDAYQGFAKQNYTMLDNLKLGYGGTATEMARLINDSGVLGDQMQVTERTVNDVSFDKIIEAIHVIQTQMGITGTTAKEASETISGSWAAAKAAFQNFITGSGSAKDLASALTVTGKNVTKTLKNLLPHLTTGLNELLAALIPELPGLIHTTLPGIIEGTGELLAGLAAALPDLIDIIIDVLPETLKKLGNKAGQVWSKNIWPLIKDFFKFAFGIELPKWEKLKLDFGLVFKNLDIGEKAKNVLSFIQDAFNWIGENKEFVTGALIAVGAAFLTVKAAVNPVGLALDALIAIIAVVVTNWEDVKEAVGTAIEEIGNFFTQTIPQAWKDMVTSVETWWNDHIVTPIQNAIAAIKEFFGLSDSGEEYTPGITGTGGNSAGLARSQFQGKGAKVAVNGMNDLANYTPGHANGLDFVPYDNYLARLHYGETVLTRKDADAWRKGNTGGMALLAAKFDQMQETFLQALEGVRQQPIAINIDSKTVAVLMAREMTKSIGNRNIQTLMGMGG